MASVYKSAFCAILTSGVLLACAIDKSQPPPRETAPPLAATAKNPQSAPPKNHTELAAPAAVSVKKPLPPKSESQRVEIVSHPAATVASVPLSPVQTAPVTTASSNSLHPQAFLPIPDPNIVESPPAVQPPTTSGAVAAQSIPHTDAPAVEQHASGQVPVTSLQPQKPAVQGVSSPYQRAMLGTNGLGVTDDHGKLQSSFILEVIFIVLIIACLFGAAWYRMNVDFGRNSRRPMRRD